MKTAWSIVTTSRLDGPAGRWLHRDRNEPTDLLLDARLVQPWDIAGVMAGLEKRYGRGTWRAVELQVRVLDYFA